MAAERRKPRGSGLSGMTNVVGGMLVGLDEQLLRSTPRVEVLVKRGQAVRGTSSQGGSLLVGLPGDPIDLGEPEEPAGAGGTAATGDAGAAR